MPLATSPSSDRLPSRPSKRVTAPRPHRETVSRVRVSMVSEKDEPAAAGRARLPTGPTGPRPRPDPDLSRISSRNRTLIADPLAGERQLDAGPARRPQPVGQVLHRALRLGLPFPCPVFPGRRIPARPRSEQRSEPDPLPGEARLGARRRPGPDPGVHRIQYLLGRRAPEARVSVLKIVPDPIGSATLICNGLRFHTVSVSVSEPSSSSSSSTGTETVFSVCRGQKVSQPEVAL